MSTTDNPYPPPEEITLTLRRVYAYWESLKRGGNSMPFWDDVNLSVIPDLGDGLLLIDVFERPERFRFNTVGQAYLGAGDRSLIHQFADEIQLPHRLRYLRSQASATVESCQPTFYRNGGAQSDRPYSRLLMPMWGNGYVGMLLGSLELH
jgi:hypothetical protein